MDVIISSQHIWKLELVNSGQKWIANLGCTVSGLRTFISSATDVAKITAKDWFWRLSETEFQLV